MAYFLISDVYLLIIFLFERERARSQYHCLVFCGHIVLVCSTSCHQYHQCEAGFQGTTSKGRDV